MDGVSLEKFFLQLSASPAEKAEGGAEQSALKPWSLGSLEQCRRLGRRQEREAWFTGVALCHQCARGARRGGGSLGITQGSGKSCLCASLQKEGERGGERDREREGGREGEGSGGRGTSGLCIARPPLARTWRTSPREPGCAA